MDGRRGGLRVECHMQVEREAPEDGHGDGSLLVPLTGWKLVAWVS